MHVRDAAVANFSTRPSLCQYGGFYFQHLPAELHYIRTYVRTSPVSCRQVLTIQMSTGSSLSRPEGTSFRLRGPYLLLPSNTYM